MANRIKEDEKNEKIIRGLLKLQANRRCINCSSLGPQYVCTNFWTFVCTTCSGIHREFTHRVKSVSMAKFTSQEVSALQGGGNERAREIYFKEWDSQRHSAPDSSNVDRLRDFIRHVYVDRRYTGERSIDKPPRVKMGDEDPHENRRVDTYRGSSRSPPYEDTHDRRYSERSGLGGRNDDRNYRYNYDERRSPGNDQETRYGNYRRSPVRFEVVDYKHRDDRFGNGRRPDGESKLEERSPNRQKDLDVSSPPMVRPVREILGEDVPPLRISEPPKANGGKAADGSARTQRTASSSSLGSIDGSSVEIKGANLGSLIDFNADPELPDATVVPPEQPTTISTAQSVTQTATTPSVDGGNWASFDFPSQIPAQAPASVPAPAPSNANTLESMLSQLSVLAPAPAPAGNMSALSIGGGTPTNAPVSNMSILPIGGGAPAAAVGNISTIPIGVGIAATPVGNMSTLPNSGGGSAAPPGGMTSMLPISGGDFFVKANDGRQFPSIQQQQPSLFTTTVNQSATPQSTVSVGGASNNQPWNSSLVQNAQGQMTATGQPSQADSKPAQETIGGVASQPALSEVKNSGRKELPEDLFAATFSTVPGWHTGTPHGMGFGMQYPTAAQMPTYLYPSKPSNPFDLNNEPTMIHAPSYPSMTSLQGALPNMAAPPGLLRTYSLGTPSHGTPSPRWMTPQSPSYASAVPPSAYMGQQVPPSNVPALGHQGGGGFGGEAALFGSVGTDQQLAGRYSQPATPNSFSSLGGNPFG